MQEKYQEVLDSFRKIFFNKDGTLRDDGFKRAQQYAEIDDKGRTSIVGNNMFSPYLSREPVDHNNPNNVRWYLKLKNGKFDDRLPWSPGKGNQSKFRIDVTDMSQEEIMGKVLQILKMSNEEVIETFGVNMPGIDYIGFIIDDVINNYFEQMGQTITNEIYQNQYYTTRYTIGEPKEQLSVTQEKINGVIEVYLNETDDSISYRIMDSKESSMNCSETKIEITEENVSSELGKKILEKIKERFTEKQITEQPPEGKTGAEKILAFMENNNLTQYDLIYALSMLSRKDKIEVAMKDLEDAMKDLNEGIRPGIKDPNKIIPEIK